MPSGIYFVKLSPMLLSYLHLCFHHLLLVPTPPLASFHQPLHGELEKIFCLNFASSSSDALLACSPHSSLSLCNSSQPLVLFFLYLSLFFSLLLKSRKFITFPQPPQTPSIPLPWPHSGFYGQKHYPWQHERSCLI